MKRMIGILVFGMILTTSGGTQDLCKDEFCKTLHKVLAARKSSFISLRTTKDEKYEKTWHVNLSLSGARSCVVSNSVPTTTDYSCTFPLESSAAAEERYQQIVGHVKRSVPSEWESKEQMHSAGGKYVRFGHGEK